MPNTNLIFREDTLEHSQIGVRQLQDDRALELAAATKASQYNLAGRAASRPLVKVYNPAAPCVDGDRVRGRSLLILLVFWRGASAVAGALQDHSLASVSQSASDGGRSLSESLRTVLISAQRHSQEREKVKQRLERFSNAPILADGPGHDKWLGRQSEKGFPRENIEL